MKGLIAQIKEIEKKLEAVDTLGGYEGLATINQCKQMRERIEQELIDIITGQVPKLGYVLISKDELGKIMKK